MALLAIRSQVKIVGVFVAAVAIAERNAGKLLKRFPRPGFFFVAGRAIHGFVFARQGKTGFVVVELSSGGKSRRGMAFGAIVGQGFLVVVFMAGIAIPLEAQESFTSFFQARVFHEIGFVALAAIDGFVRPCQFKSGQVVIEFIFVETDDIEIAAVVVAVAGETIFPFGLFGGMVTGAAIQPGFDLLVTVQAFFVGDFIAQNMAFCAIEYPFQMGVRLRQLARRNLGIHLYSKKGEAKDNM